LRHIIQKIYCPFKATPEDEDFFIETVECAPSFVSIELLDFKCGSWVSFSLCKDWRCLSNPTSTVRRFGTGNWRIAKCQRHNSHGGDQTGEQEQGPRGEK
jgi:hypothetical protein